MDDPRKLRFSHQKEGLAFLVMGSLPRDLKDLEGNWKGTLDAKEPHVERLQNESPEVLEEAKGA